MAPSMAFRPALVCVAVLSAGCYGHAQEASEVQRPGFSKMLGPTSAEATGKDFIDAKGRRWIAVGKVVPQAINVAEMESHNANYRPAPPPPPQTLPVQILAEKLRPRRLVGGYEYRLEQPDFELAETILFGGTPRPTDSFRPSNVGEQKFIIGVDNRVRVGTPSVYPGSAFAHLSQTCTATMIGPSTALCAAHCFYNQNGWIQSQSIAFGADTVPPGPGAPFGSSLADSVTLPGAWNGTEWDWDFAVLDFGTSSLGRSTGWFGTEANDGTTAPTDDQTIIGYPFDKPVPSSWLKSGNYLKASGARYEHNIAVVSGDSGACAYNVHGRCTGIQSTQWCCGSDPSNWARIWNEVRRWDSTTYNFFHAYSNWPAQ